MIKKMVKVFIGVALFFFLLGVVPVPARAAASLYLSPGTQSVSAGELFSVQVKVDTGGEAVTTVDAKITYPSSILSLSSVGKVGSFVTNWQTEDASVAGAVRYIGFKSTPGYASPPDGLFLTLNFMAVSTGTATVVFDESVSKVHRDDEFATDILGSTVGGVYTIATADGAAGDSGDDGGSGGVGDAGGSGDTVGNGAGGGGNGEVPAAGFALPTVLWSVAGLLLIVFGFLGNLL